LTATPANLRLTDSVLEAELAQQVLRGEKLRLNILICAVLGALLLLNLLPFILLDEMQRAFHGTLRSFQLGITAVCGLAILYLVIERVLVARHLREGKPFSEWRQYVSAFIETSIPTAGIFFTVSLLGPVNALTSPVILWYPLFILLSALRLNFRITLFTGLVAAASYLSLAFWLITRPASQSADPFLIAGPQHLIKGIFLLAMAVMTGFVTLQIKRRVLNSAQITEERNRISRMFGQHVSPEVMKELLEQQPDRLSEERYVCVMFLDIRGFTSFAETKRPEEVVAYLDSLFEFMIEIVNRNNGIINKFLGDGFMAVFGAPLSDGREDINAVNAAREILARLTDECAQNRILPTTLGIGLHSGTAVTGRVGSAVRQEYTVIGDVVNLASRIEQLNKQFNSQLLISEEVWNAARDQAATAERIGETHVKGRAAPIQIYRLA